MSLKSVCAQIIQQLAAGLWVSSTNKTQEIVNNSSNINKMNNYLSPQAIEYQTHNIHGVAIQVLAGDRHKNVAGLNL